MSPDLMEFDNPVLFRTNLGIHIFDRAPIGRDFHFAPRAEYDRVSISGRGRNFCLSHRVQGSGAHPASYPMGAGA